MSATRREVEGGPLAAGTSRAEDGLDVAGRPGDPAGGPARGEPLRPHIDIPDQAGTRRRRQVRVRTLMLAIVAAAWFVALRAPGVGPLVLAAAGAVVAVLVGFAAMMGLGWLGFGLFALFDRAAAWTRRASRWPDD